MTTTATKTVQVSDIDRTLQRISRALAGWDAPALNNFVSELEMAHEECAEGVEAFVTWTSPKPSRGHLPSGASRTG